MLSFIEDFVRDPQFPLFAIGMTMMVFALRYRAEASFDAAFIQTLAMVVLPVAILSMIVLDMGSRKKREVDNKIVAIEELLSYSNDDKEELLEELKRLKKEQFDLKYGGKEK